MFHTYTLTPLIPQNQVNYVAVLLCKRVDGSLVIIKEGFVDYELHAEIQAYKLLETHGLLLSLLQLIATH
jgi:hypothetical protein